MAVTLTEAADKKAGKTADYNAERTAPEGSAKSEPSKSERISITLVIMMMMVMLLGTCVAVALWGQTDVRGMSPRSFAEPGPFDNRIVPGYRAGFITMNMDAEKLESYFGVHGIMRPQKNSVLYTFPDRGIVVSASDGRVTSVFVTSRSYIVGVNKNDGFVGPIQDMAFVKAVPVIPETDRSIIYITPNEEPAEAGSASLERSITGAAPESVKTAGTETVSESAEETKGSPLPKAAAQAEPGRDDAEENHAYIRRNGYYMVPVPAMVVPAPNNEIDYSDNLRVGSDVSKVLHLFGSGYESSADGSTADGQALGDSYTLHYWSSGIHFGIKKDKVASIMVCTEIIEEVAGQ